MSHLEKFIRDNKDAFNQDSPKTGHEDRFQEKLKNFEPQTPKKHVHIWLKIAAVGLLLIVSSIVVFTIYPDNSNHTNAAEEQMSLGEVSSEYKEVETYLKGNLDNKIQEFEQLQCPTGDVEKEEIRKELKALDTVYQELQQDLKHNPKNERIINAMINTYQTKIEILEQVISQVKSNC